MPHSQSQDHRLFHRIAHDAPASVAQGSATLKARIIDLSLKGCMLELDDGVNLDADGEFLIEIRLSDEMRITMEARLIHQQGSRAGFKCAHIDIDSISTLRRLVELNLGDPNLLDRDLEALASSH